MSNEDTIVAAALKGARLSTSIDEDEFWSKNTGAVARTRAYIGYSQRVPVNSKVIFYETMSGARMGDNPYAIFDYVRSLPEFEGYLHVWSIEAKGEIPERFRKTPNVVFARRNTASFAYFLACAGYIICNANLPGFFVRRSEQRYLNTWHGIPYKMLGRDTPNARFGVPTSTGSFIKATHVLSACRFMTDAVRSAYSMTGTSNAKIAETGYPRVDLTVRLSAQDPKELRARLGLTVDEGRSPKPVILYAPTWRSDGEGDVVDTDQLLTDLNALTALDAHVLYRGHHRMDRIIRDHMVGDEVGQVVIPSHEISSNELMSAVDILITDYSSIFFDFLPTGRPIIQYLYDLEEYKRTRGLNLDLDELPGSVAFTTAELVAAVEEAVTALRSLPVGHDLPSEPVQGEKYRLAQLRFSPHEDGNASQRAVDFFFKDEIGSTPVVACRDDRKSVVYWAGTFKEEAESNDFLTQVIESGESPDEQTTLVIDRESSVANAALKSIKSLKTLVSTISYSEGAPVLLRSETEAYQQFVSQEALSVEEVGVALEENPVLHRVFVREYRRRMDDVQFDSVVLSDTLSVHEKAVAYFADNTRSIAQDLRPSKKKKQQPPTSPLRRLIGRVLPKGSTRRKRVAAAYRALRGQKAKSAATKTK